MAKKSAYGFGGVGADSGAVSSDANASPARNRGKSPNTGPPAKTPSRETYRGGDSTRNEYLDGTPLSKASTSKISKAASAQEDDTVGFDR